MAFLFHDDVCLMRIVEGNIIHDGTSGVPNAES